MVLVLCGVRVMSQDLRKMYEYDFDGALAEYTDSLKTLTDSLARAPFEQAARWAENGISLTEYCLQPVVVARKLVPREEFFLYYPLADGAWHETQDSSKIVYDISGREDWIERPVRDSLEFFPMVCGRDRYFSSKDLYGMGGYDLYVCHWNARTRDWGEPQNMGFPYSSPYDDFLFMNTEDGRYSIFASNRECSEDSVWVYVLEYEANPVHSAVSDPARLKEIAALCPGESKVSEKRADKAPDEQTARYMAKLSEVRAYRRQVSEISRELDRMRDAYLLADSQERAALSEALTEGEFKLTSVRASLDKSSKELNAMEVDFVLNGVEINISDFVEEEPAQKPEQSTYNFVKKRMGTPLGVKWITEN